MDLQAHAWLRTHIHTHTATISSVRIPAGRRHHRLSHFMRKNGCLPVRFVPIIYSHRVRSGEGKVQIAGEQHVRCRRHEILGAQLSRTCRTGRREIINLLWDFTTNLFHFNGLVNVFSHWQKKGVGEGERDNSLAQQKLKHFPRYETLKRWQTEEILSEVRWSAAPNKKTLWWSEEKANTQKTPSFMVSFGIVYCFIFPIRSNIFSLF